MEHQLLRGGCHTDAAGQEEALEGGRIGVRLRAPPLLAAPHLWSSALFALVEAGSAACTCLLPQRPFPGSPPSLTYGVISGRCRDQRACNPVWRGCNWRLLVCCRVIETVGKGTLSEPHRVRQFRTKHGHAPSGNGARHGGGGCASDVLEELRRQQIFGPASRARRGTARLTRR
nr:unnamed protein product [Digitaria exilis]